MSYALLAHKNRACRHREQQSTLLDTQNPSQLFSHTVILVFLNSKLEKGHFHIPNQIFKKEIHMSSSSRTAEIEASRLSITFDYMYICIVSEKLEKGVFRFSSSKSSSRSPVSMFLGCDMFRMRLTGNISPAFQRDRSFPSSLSIWFDSTLLDSSHTQ